MSFVGPGGSFGFLMCPATIALQTLLPPFEQALICTAVIGRSFCATTEMVCGSSLGLPPYVNVIVPPLFTVTAPGAKNIDGRTHHMSLVHKTHFSV
jgi:hypothetical protein